MKISTNWPKITVLVLLVGSAVIFLFQLIDPRGDSTRTDISIPKLTALAEKGEKAFAANCAACHGVNAAGTDKGPPLVHDIYNPGHHSDVAFYLAAKNGVRQHHWPFGNMPPQPQVSEADLEAILKYVRELQVANGITSRPHKM
ncbi:cytochrome c [Sneathiella sp.]|mgnify:CR=1 FL=1|jgi:mono/diheme cytochrome c family protein|uniref:c-type cytochrome n=1 Tax=Sneathiella sp. TaxID=1964365 RepID=UPI002609289F|nr:cytochrome c [Sneathiella sp.]MDF2366070.1 cytochrome c [Sneathiella sp.]|tara:strand:- start:1196 stop:1627 length:432 start_codon:yes stop_codon:yes gene_type:complete